MKKFRVFYNNPDSPSNGQTFVVYESEQWPNHYLQSDTPHVSTLAKKYCTIVDENAPVPIELIKSLGLSVAELMKENAKLKEYSNTQAALKLEVRIKELEDAVKSALWVAKYYDKGKFKHLTGIAEQALNKK